MKIGGDTMRAEKLAGVIIAIPTPLTSEENIDTRSLIVKSSW